MKSGKRSGPQRASQTAILEEGSKDVQSPRGVNTDSGGEGTFSWVGRTQSPCREAVSLRGLPEPLRYRAPALAPEPQFPHGVAAKIQ